MPGVGKLPYMMRLHDRIKMARKAAGLTQEQLANRIGVSRPAVVMWERDKTKSLEAENLLRAAYATRVDPLWLATGEGEMRPGRLARGEPVPQRLVDAWHLINDEHRKHVIAIVEAIAGSDKRGR